MAQPDKKSIAQMVRRYIKDRHPGGVTLDVVDQGVRKEEHWWSVPIRPSAEPPKLFEYYEALAEVEGELEEHEKVTVVLVPASPG